MYVDESGDAGLNTIQTRYFCLSGIVVHESEWRNFINRLISFRKVLKSVYGLPIRAELHASEYIRRQIFNIPKHDRLAILRNTLDEMAKINFISITNVVVDKQGKPDTYDVFESAWGTLFQRFENTLNHGNFPGGHKSDYGIIITDATAGKKLTRIMRRMAVYNYIPNSPPFGLGSRNIPIIKIIEDPSERDSADSLPIQACDVSAYFLQQRYNPNAFIRKKRAVRYFDRLAPILNTRASRFNRLGVVEL